MMTTHPSSTAAVPGGGGDLLAAEWGDYLAARGGLRWPPVGEALAVGGENPGRNGRSSMAVDTFRVQLTVRPPRPA